VDRLVLIHPDPPSAETSGSARALESAAQCIWFVVCVETNSAFTTTMACVGARAKGRPHGMAVTGLRSSGDLGRFDDLGRFRRG
jgi:hypothetical protein